MTTDAERLTEILNRLDGAIMFTEAEGPFDEAVSLVGAHPELMPQLLAWLAVADVDGEPAVLPPTVPEPPVPVNGRCRRLDCRAAAVVQVAFRYAGGCQWVISDPYCQAHADGYAISAEFHQITGRQELPL